MRHMSFVCITLLLRIYLEFHYFLSCVSVPVPCCPANTRLVRLYYTIAMPGWLTPQITALKDSIKEMNRQRARQERIFDKERNQFREQLSARVKEIQQLKRDNAAVSEKVQVCICIVRIDYPGVSLLPPDDRLFCICLRFLRPMFTCFFSCCLSHPSTRPSQHPLSRSITPTVFTHTPLH